MRVLVINPNSSIEVTRSIARALAPLGDHFDVVRYMDGPETIRSDDDVAFVAHGVADIAASRPEAAGFVTACFSDPGLDLARGRVRQPVTGAQEAAVLEACSKAERYGIIALSERAIPRHLRRIETMGHLDRLVAEVPLKDVTAAESGRDPEVYSQILRLATELRDRGAGAIVLGCAGMAQITSRLGADLNIPIIDPVVAAGRLALERVRAAGAGDHATQ